MERDINLDEISDGKLYETNDLGRDWGGGGDEMGLLGWGSVGGLCGVLPRNGGYLLSWIPGISAAYGEPSLHV